MQRLWKIWLKNSAKLKNKLLKKGTKFVWSSNSLAKLFDREESKEGQCGESQFSYKNGNGELFDVQIQISSAKWTERYFFQRFYEKLVVCIRWSCLFFKKQSDFCPIFLSKLSNFVPLFY